MSEIMEMAGWDPACVYAFRKTGLIVTEMNQHLIPTRHLQDWNAAVEEYRRTSGRISPPTPAI